MPAWTDKREAAYAEFAQEPSPSSEAPTGSVVFFDESYIPAGDPIPEEVVSLVARYQVQLCQGCDLRVGDPDSFKNMVAEGVKQTNDPWCTGVRPRRMVSGQPNQDKISIVAFSPNKIFHATSSVPCAQLKEPIKLE